MHASTIWLSLNCVQLKDKATLAAYKPGQQLDVTEIFKEGDKVDVAGTSIGKGFQGESQQAAAARACSHSLQYVSQQGTASAMHSASQRCCNSVPFILPHRHHQALASRPWCVPGSAAETFPCLPVFVLPGSALTAQPQPPSLNFDLA